MITDSTFANFSVFYKVLDCGDTGKGRAERMSFSKLRFTH